MSTENLSSGSSARSYWHYGELVPVVHCECGHELPLQTCWDRSDPGRRFHKCPRFGQVGGCGFERWFDPPMCNRARKIIHGLLKRLNRAEEEKKENAEMRMKKRAKVDQSRERIKELKHQIKTLNRNNGMYKSMVKVLLCVVITFFVMFWMKRLENRSLKGF